MAQEDKELLLKDLCARLPYGVIVETPKEKGHVCDINLTIFETKVGVNINATGRDKFNIEDIKPYLFPMSSMTEGQKMFLKQQNWCIAISTSGTVETTIEGIDWLNKNHFDYRGLIPMGLAIPVTKENNPYK